MIVVLMYLALSIGYFVRISPKKISVSHPDAIRAILLTPLRKVSAIISSWNPLQHEGWLTTAAFGGITD